MGLMCVYHRETFRVAGFFFFLHSRALHLKTNKHRMQWLYNHQEFHLNSAIQQISHLMKRQNHESSSSAGFHNYGNKFGVDCAECTIPRDPGHPDVIIALVVLHRLAEHMPELTLSHNPFEHICREKQDENEKWSHHMNARVLSLNRHEPRTGRNGWNAY